MFGGFSYDIQLNTTNPEDMDNLDELLNFDWMDHVANQMEIEMAIQMERKYPKQQNRKVYIGFFYLLSDRNFQKFPGQKSRNYRIFRQKSRFLK